MQQMLWPRRLDRCSCVSCWQLFVGFGVLGLGVRSFHVCWPIGIEVLSSTLDARGSVALACRNPKGSMISKRVDWASFVATFGSPKGGADRSSVNVCYRSFPMAASFDGDADNPRWEPRVFKFSIRSGRGRCSPQLSHSSVKSAGKDRCGAQKDNTL